MLFLPKISLSIVKPIQQNGTEGKREADFAASRQMISWSSQAHRSSKNLETPSVSFLPLFSSLYPSIPIPLKVASKAQSNTRTKKTRLWTRPRGRVPRSSGSWTSLASRSLMWASPSRPLPPPEPLGLPSPWAGVLSHLVPQQFELATSLLVWRQETVVACI